MHKPYCCINMCIYIYIISTISPVNLMISPTSLRGPGPSFFFHPEEMEASTSDMAMPWGRTVNRRGKSPKRHFPYMFHICLYMFSNVAASPMTYPCIFWSHIPNVSIPRGIFHLLGHLLGPQNGDPFVKCRPSNDR